MTSTSHAETPPADVAGVLLPPPGAALDQRTIWRQWQIADYAARVSEALAGTLNQRRTAGRTVSLAVPELGSWACVCLLEGTSVRQVLSDPAAPSTGRVLERRRGSRVAADLTAAALALPVAGVLRPLADKESLRCAGAGEGAAADLAALGAARVFSVPMRSHGQTLGSLHVAGGTDGTDRTDRPDLADPPEPDPARCRELARRAALALGAARIYEERAALADTLRIALLPPALPSIPGLQVGARYRAALETTEIGGDFYEISPLGGGRWTLSVGDVCGKGVEAAVLTGRVRQSLRTAVLADAEPSRTLALLNAAMLSTDGNRFVTLLHGWMHPTPEGTRIRLACGGHPRPLVLRVDGRVEAVDIPGTLVGMLPDVRFAVRDVTLAPGETMLCYTDGITEARVGDQQLGPARLHAVLADCRGMPAQAVADRVEQLVLEYLGGRPHDDLAVVALRAEPA